MNFSLFAAIQRSLILFSLTFLPVSPVWAQASLAMPRVDALERTLRGTWVGADDVIAPEKLQRIKRQVYEQENDIGSYDATTANGKTPNLPASVVAPVPLPTPADAQYHSIVTRVGQMDLATIS